jgi:hypothetical protein
VHPEAYAGLGWAITQARLDRHAPLRVLDVGGQDVNGTAHDWFTHPDTTVTTLDIEHADIIADARSWVPDRLFDVVMATEVFEHVEDWRAVLDTMRRALDPDSRHATLLATCASTGRPAHGATGAPLPGPGEWYGNVEPDDLTDALSGFPWREVRYQAPPGDAYLWARPYRALDISVCIPTIPSRKLMLAGALASVQAQTLQPLEVLVEEAALGEGPAVVRNRLLQRAQAPYVAFLDDDDWLLPHHLHTLACAWLDTDGAADVVWPWFRVEGGSDPFPAHRGRQWDPANPHIFPITVLANRQAILDVGGFTDGSRTAPDGRTVSGEDWRLWCALSDAGATFHHIDEVTWVWRHHAGNTSGRPRP